MSFKKAKELPEENYRMAQIPVRVTYIERAEFQEKAKLYTGNNVSALIRAAVRAFNPPMKKRVKE